MDRILSDVRTFFSQHGDGIIVAYVFGSVARGGSRVDSDVDVGILFSTVPAPALDGPVLAIEGELEQALRRPVEVVALNNASADLVHRVLRDGVIVYESDRSARIRFEVAKRNEYFDLLPILRRYRRIA
jgi:predicted nucleotidyltransferase